MLLKEHLIPKCRICRPDCTCLILKFYSCRLNLQSELDWLVGSAILFLYLFVFYARAIETLEQILTETDIDESTTLTADGLVAFLYKLKRPFEGLQIPEDKNRVRLNFK